MEIAVFLDASGKTQSIVQPGIIKVYDGSKGTWKITKEIIFRIDNIAGIKEIRGNIINMAEELGNCKVFVGREIKGMTYNILDGMGFNTWELEGTPMELLEFVFEKEMVEAKLIKLSELENVKPIIQKVKDGHYYVNLKKIQKNNESLTSKSILIPFLTTTIFYQLEIICGHIPPWFHAEFEKLNLKMETTHISQSEIKVMVYPDICKE
ncbi:Fe-only nitrogenase accessory protein AnfO [Clostridium estertheticum]|uniref:Fe-only nitrogenase accessory protein AnfO n=1 Tax=Clostridium estertheticum TaxID=238834 RepID=UPI001C6E6825|nr:Fe-only nitrogenase accessory protein AnfO [Clostridium estertheticum]MBW9153342.1 Fe-only nitrogenase accessory protein AnfO [Clostridium estertheticum]WLC83045.1 Fe-only nitrogenase accessory protein AnfO [Clostridium estertheticum]